MKWIFNKKQHQYLPLVIVIDLKLSNSLTWKEIKLELAGRKALLMDILKSITKIKENLEGFFNKVKCLQEKWLSPTVLFTQVNFHFINFMESVNLNFPQARSSKETGFSVH